MEIGSGTCDLLGNVVLQLGAIWFQGLSSPLGNERRHFYQEFTFIYFLILHGRSVSGLFSDVTFSDELFFQGKENLNS